MLMRNARWGLRLLGILTGSGLCLGGAALMAQDTPTDTPTPSTKAPKAKKGLGKSVAKKGEMDDEKPEGDMPRAKGKRGAARTTKKAETKAATPAPAPAPATAAADSAIKFSRDVAPILVGNCVGCHNPRTKARNGGFDLSTFNGLMAGGKSGKVIVGGKPEESRLVELVSTQDMPRGNRGKLSEEAVGRIERWVKAGALLDAGVEATAALEKIAATPEQLRQLELARQTPEQRDKKIQEVAADRWKKASSKGSPEMTAGKNFLLFSNLPKPRAERLLKSMEAQRTSLGGILGREGSKALSGPEKISLYVFNDVASYVEFVRSVESRENEQGIEAHGRLDVEQPYVAAVDPLNGGEEAAPAKAKAPRSKKAATEAESGPDRSLAGVVSEALGASAANAGGKPPRWLSQGLGAYLALQIDPRGSTYYSKMRSAAGQQYGLGWDAKANETLGDQGDPETVRALGFSLCEWMGTSHRAEFPYFVQGLLAGREKLDEAVRGCFGDQVGRQDFLDEWGAFVASRYGTGRRR